jgi:NitT/TauT family transport system substrate-binding protein
MQRRSFLQLSTRAGLVTLTTSCAQSAIPGTQRQSMPSSGANDRAHDTSVPHTAKIAIGHATVASALPLFCAVQQGFFSAAGLTVEMQKMVTPQTTVEGMIANRLQGCSNGTAVGSLAVAALASPDLFRIIAANASNQTFVLDEIIVAKDSAIQSIRDLDGKSVGCGLGPQNQAIAKALLAKNGVKAAQIIPMEISQHPAAVASGQLAAAYTLEPSGTIGQRKNLTRTLETGVVAKYILGDPLAPWFGGAATLSTTWLQQFPEPAKQYIAAYRQGVDFVRRHPAQARQYLVGYTPITADLASAVPLADYRMYDEFTAQDLRYFQQYLDFLQTVKILRQRLEVTPLLYPV